MDTQGLTCSTRRGARLQRLECGTRLENCWCIHLYGCTERQKEYVMRLRATIKTYHGFNVPYVRLFGREERQLR